jgi:hypothetical protein
MPLLGTLLADTAGLFIALIAAGVLRLAGSLMYIALGVGAPTAEATS